jgi:hypothetical protein
MTDFFHPLATMPPFPPAATPQPQFPYTVPLAQRPFPPLRIQTHIGFPSYSSSSTHSFAFPPGPPPGYSSTFEESPITDIVLAPPSFEHNGPASPIDEGFGFSKEERRASIIKLTLAPLTCPKSTIHVIVEENDKIQKFPIHRDLLCFYSSYFLRVLNDNKVVKAKIKQKNHRREWRWEDKESVDEIMEIGGSADSETKLDVDVVIKLPDVVRDFNPDTKENEGADDLDPEMKFSNVVRELKLDTAELGYVTRAAFAGFVSWLYHGYPGFGLFHPLENHPVFDAVTLIQLWVFAGRIGVPECQNHCIEGIEWWRMTSNIIQTSMLGWVYENTQEYDEGECGLRALLIDQCAWKLDGKWLLGELEGTKNEEQFPRQALVDLVSRMRVVLNEHVPPPFLNSELRKEAYWMEVEQKRVCDVL